MASSMQNSVYLTLTHLKTKTKRQFGWALKKGLTGEAEAGEANKK